MFSIETAKNGKPHIIFNNYKYRLSYSVKNGDIIWRCLGKTCGATLKTDENKKTLLLTNDKHSGPHPVTLRSLSSPGPAVSTPTTPAAEPSPPTPCSSTPKSAPPHAALPIPLTEQEAEIIRLKEENTRLAEQMQNVLDHSIESDTRLLKFTNKIFITKSAQEEEIPRVSKSERSTQCDPTTSHCTDPRCVITGDLLSSLKPTIEVLEAEVAALKAEAKSCSCVKYDTQDKWTLSSKKYAPIPTQNRYRVLSEDNNQTCSFPQVTTKPNSFGKSREVREPPKNKHYKNNKNSSPKKPTTSKIETKQSRTSLSFRSITVEGDSHARGLAALIREKVEAPSVIRGVCKPGAKLGGVTSGELPPPGSCYILIAGTNDIAAGEPQNIFEGLEQRINTCLKTANVIVSSIPHRHDLPQEHLVNQQIRLTNAYIEELCVRLNIIMLDFNSIPRRLFTHHGMHLRLPGKKLLASLILKDLEAASTSMSSKWVSAHHLPLPANPGPRTLPHSSFADALKYSASAAGQSAPTVSTIPTSHCGNGSSTLGSTNPSATAMMPTAKNPLPLLNNVEYQKQNMTVYRNKNITCKSFLVDRSCPVEHLR